MMRDRKLCENCGARNRVGSTFCADCGTELPKPEPEPVAERTEGASRAIPLWAVVVVTVVVSASGTVAVASLVDGSDDGTAVAAETDKDAAPVETPVEDREGELLTYVPQDLHDTCEPAVPGEGTAQIEPLAAMTCEVGHLADPPADVTAVFALYGDEQEVDAAYKEQYRPYVDAGLNDVGGGVRPCEVGWGSESKWSGDGTKGRMACFGDPDQARLFWTTEGTPVLAGVEWFGKDIGMEQPYAIWRRITGIGPGAEPYD